jgi:hypothetical protein
VTVGLAVTAAARPVAHVVPSPGTPDLSQMVLQPSDLSSPGTIQQDGYTQPPSGPVTASYLRVFGPSAAGGSTLVTIGSSADLLTDVGTAETVFSALNRVAHTRRGQQALLRPFIQSFNRGAGKRVLTLADVHVLRVHSLGVGDGSVILPTVFRVAGVRFSLDYVVVRVDRGIGVLTMIGAGRIHAPDALGLARAIAGHMQSVLLPATASS